MAVLLRLVVIASLAYCIAAFPLLSMETLLSMRPTKLNSVGSADSNVWANVNSYSDIACDTPLATFSLGFGYCFNHQGQSYSYSLINGNQLQMTTYSQLDCQGQSVSYPVKTNQCNYGFSMSVAALPAPASLLPQISLYEDTPAHTLCAGTPGMVITPLQLCMSSSLTNSSLLASCTPNKAWVFGKCTASACSSPSCNEFVGGTMNSCVITTDGKYTAQATCQA